MKHFPHILMTIGLTFGLGYGIVFEGQSLIPASAITESALTAGKQAMEVIAENMANQYTTRDPEGNPYKAKQVALQTMTITGEDGSVMSGVKVGSVEKDPRKGFKVYNPQHPHANEEGYVEQSNVRMADEMVSMMKYSRWVEGEYAMMTASVKMAQNALNLGR